jgi:hypothetical protein
MASYGDEWKPTQITTGKRRWIWNDGQRMAFARLTDD